MLPPPTPDIPAPAEMPWFKIQDQHVSSLSMSPSSSLHHIKSVQQIEESLDASGLGGIMGDCSMGARCEHHPSISPYCVFRPCSHFACRACYDRAVSNSQSCPSCGGTIERFVGVQSPIGGTAARLSEDDEAATGEITVIHLPFDRVSPLYSEAYCRTR